MVPRSVARACRYALGSILAFAGVSHLSFGREEFQGQVPDWVPMEADRVVLLSGLAEITLGVVLLTRPQHSRTAGLAAAGFFVGVFPGNIHQYRARVNAFGLDSDRKRLVRLFFQPVLVAAALAAAQDSPQRG